MERKTWTVGHGRLLVDKIIGGGVIEGLVIEGLVIEDGVIEDGVIKGWVIETVIILWLPGMTLASSKN